MANTTWRDSVTLLCRAPELGRKGVEWKEHGKEGRFNFITSDLEKE
jgi:hypothetical protein